MTKKELLCPDCGAAMILRSGKFGKFYGCSIFPKCRKTLNLDVVSALIEIENAVPEREFKPSPYQQSIFDFISDGEGNALVEAVAGSGKTTTIVKALAITPNDASVIFCAFNTHIAKELARKAPRHVKVGTLHSIGFAALRAALPNKPEVDNRKVYNIIKEYLPLSEQYPLRAPLARLVSLCKANLVNPTDKDAVSALVDHYDIDVNGDFELMAIVLPEILLTCMERTSIIDYDDMIWLPIVLNLHIKSYDWVFIDECLPYHTPVLLADRSSMSIGDIVENKEPVSVLAYDTKSGKQRSRKVIGWHKILNRKPLVKVKVRKGTNPNLTYKTWFVVCTEDHKIWADGKWVEAGKLRPGMIAQVETSAEKSQMYKLTSSGRKVVSKTMTAKNKSGIHRDYPKKGVDPFTAETRGGNGRPLTLPQTVVLEGLGEGWTPEYPISTGHGGRSRGYPANYKVDIGNPTYKVAVELDAGLSGHNDKKDELLNELGWTVIRIDNTYAVQNTDECVATVLAECGCVADDGCPIDAVVLSVEPVDIKDWYVYDIDVEGCHNFYANGILVHNCQDLNKVQIELVLRLINYTGRCVAVGDRCQGIYGFRGADVDAVPNLISALNATILPLSTTYRCPKSHVALAKKLVPQIEAAEWAEDGFIRDTSYYEMITDIREGDLVLCRVNAPLVKTCYSFIKRGMKATIRGRDIGKQLETLVDRMKATTIHDLLRKLDVYMHNEMTKLEAAGKESRIASLVDRVETLIALCDGVNDLGDLRYRISSIFDDVTRSGVTLSSVHRAKGCESNRVYILHPELMPHPLAKSEWQLSQELNVKYVALTRSKSELIFVIGEA